MVTVRFASSTAAPAQIFASNSSLPTTRPARSTSRQSVSNIFGVIGTAAPLRSSRRSLGSSRNAPNSYTTPASRPVSTLSDPTLPRF